MRFVLVLLFSSGLGAQTPSKTVTVPAAASLLLAGVPAGARIERPYSARDQAPANTAVEIGGVMFSTGARITFSASGTTANGNYPDAPRREDITAEGYIELGGRTIGTDYGIDPRPWGMGSIIAPLNALIGVFLPDGILSQVPPDGKQITVQERNERVQRPQLRQPFYIGTGVTPLGEVREVYVPIGARKLFLGVMSGENSSASGALQVTATISPAPKVDSNELRPANLSTRVYVGTGDRVAVVGLALKGEGTRSYLVRAVGPTLRNFGLTSVLPEPHVQVYNQAGVLVSEFRGWDSSLAATFSAVGAFALTEGSVDAAAVLRLAEGTYTFTVSSELRSTRPPILQEGFALLEVYELP
jgi:hypothetical protein